MKTIGEHFHGLEEMTDLAAILDLISFGHYPAMDDDKLHEQFDEEEQAALIRHFIFAVGEFAEQPFRGAATCVLFMNIVMKRLKKLDNIDVIRTPWVPVIRELQAAASADAERAKPKQTELTPRAEIELRKISDRDALQASVSDGFELLSHAARNAGIDIAPYKGRLGFVPTMSGWRGGWLYLSKLPDLPKPLAKLRDWLWEHDAAPDKPEAPPWS